MASFKNKAEKLDKDLVTKEDKLKAIQTRIQALATAEVELNKKLENRDSICLLIEEEEVELKKLKKDKTKLKKELVTLNSELSVNKREAKAFSDKMVKRSTDFETQSDKALLELNKELDTLNGKKDKLDDKISNRKLELADLNQEVKLITKDKESAIKEVFSNIKEARILDLGNIEAKKDLEKLTLTISENLRTGMAVEKQLAKLEKEEKALISKNKELQAENIALEKTLISERKKADKEFAKKTTEIVIKEGELSRDIQWVSDTKKDLLKTKTELENIYKKPLNHITI